MLLQVCWYEPAGLAASAGADTNRIVTSGSIKSTNMAQWRHLFFVEFGRSTNPTFLRSASPFDSLCDPMSESRLSVILSLLSNVFVDAPKVKRSLEQH